MVALAMDRKIRSEGSIGSACESVQRLTEREIKEVSSRGDLV